MHAEIRRLAPLVPTAIEEAKRVMRELEERVRSERPGIGVADLRLAVATAFASEYSDLAHAEMIAQSRAEGLDDRRVAQELALVEAQGMW